MRLLESVASTNSLSFLSHLRTISKNCANFYMDSSWVRFVISILVKTSTTFSQFYTVLLKRENDNEAAYLFQTFLLEAWIQQQLLYSYFKTSFKREINAKTPSFWLLWEPHNQCFYCRLFFLTPPLPPNKNQPLAQLNPYSSASVQHLTWTVLSHAIQLFYFKK